MSNDKNLNCDSPQSLAKSTTLEKIMYGVGDLGANFCLSFIMGFISLYYTSSVGIAAGVVGTMMLVSRLLDGVTDIIMGAIIERTNTRFGKVRPWIGISAPLMGASILFCFNVPQDLTESGKVIYMYISFILTVTVITTIYNMAIVAILPRISQDPKDQNKAASIRQWILTIGVSAMYALTTKLVTKYGGFTSQEAWKKTAMIYAAVCFVLVFLFFLAIREKIPADNTSQEAADKVPLKDFFKAVLTIPHGASHALLLLLIFFLCYVFGGGVSTMNTYYYTYVGANFELLGLQSTVGMIGNMVLIPITVLLANRFGRRKILAATAALSAVASLARLAAPTNPTVYLVFGCISAWCYTPVNTMMWTMVPELVNYVQRKTGLRAEGVVSSAAGVGIKIGQGVGAALGGWTLALGHFDNTLAVQPASLTSAIIIGAMVVPAVAELLILVCVSCWKLDRLEG